MLNKNFFLEFMSFFCTYNKFLNVPGGHLKEKNASWRPQKRFWAWQNNFLPYSIKNLYKTYLNFPSGVFLQKKVAEICSGIYSGKSPQTPLSLIDSLSRWSFCSESSRHCVSQTVRARKRRECSPPQRVSHVQCQVSGVMFHMSSVQLFKKKLYLTDLV